jgi:hypothetical protein
LVQKVDYDDICKHILKMEHVRFAGICDESGEIRYGGQRKDVERILSPEETKRSLLQALARWKLRYDLGRKSGRGKYAMAEYEKMKRITIPMDETHLLLVTTDVQADHGKIIEDVLRLKARIS